MITHPIRVVVANQPRLMRPEGTQPDFLIIALHESDQRPKICDVLLRRHPKMKILALAPERNSSIFVWATCDIHSSTVEASEAGILATLRGGNQQVGG